MFVLSSAFISTFDLEHNDTRIWKILHVSITFPNYATDLKNKNNRMSRFCYYVNCQMALILKQTHYQEMVTLDCIFFLFYTKSQLNLKF